MAELRQMTERELLDEVVAKLKQRFKRPKAACIGAMGNARDDPSPFYLSSLLARKHVTVVDCQDINVPDKYKTELQKQFFNLEERLVAKLNEKTREGKPLPKELLRQIASFKVYHTGLGGLWNYRLSAKFTREEYPELNGKNIKLKPGHAGQTGLRHSSTQLILDRGTSEKLKPAELIAGINHYISIIPETGVSLIISHATPSKNASNLHYSDYRLIKKILRQAKNNNPIHVEEVLLSGHGYPKPFDPFHKYERAFVITKLPAQKEKPKGRVK